MAITKRTLKRTNAKGETVERVVWRSRIPDPARPGSASHKVERTFSSKREAQAWETSQRSAIASGSYIERKTGNTTLAEVADAWRETWNAKPLRRKTQTEYASILETHVLPRWGDVKVSTIDAKGIQQWVNGIAAKRHPETTHHAYNVLRQVLKTAVVHKLIVTNPASKDAITLPSKKAANATKEQLYLTPGELRDLVEAMPVHWRTPTLVAGLCGLRPSELWGLRRSDVDLLHNRLTIVYTLENVNGQLSAAPTKSHAKRALTVPSPILADIRGILDSPGVRVRTVGRGKARQGGYPAIVKGELGWTDDPASGDRLLFTMPSGSRVDHGNFDSRVYRPVRNKLWPEGHRLHSLRWYDLRHTAASLAIAATGNLGVVQKRLGHSSISLTYDTYGHMLPEADKSLADALGTMYSADDEPSNVVDLKEAK